VQLTFDFFKEPARVDISQLKAPNGYTGLYAFHKYWGKKPCEPIAYIIESLTHPGQVILDPFVGSGITARESILRSRKFIGIDINPVATELSRLLLNPPRVDLLEEAVSHVTQAARERIQKTYLLDNGVDVATHYLWDDENLYQVWTSGRDKRRRHVELPPTSHDIRLSESFRGYRSKCIRSPRFSDNSRINATHEMSLDDILTGRAQHNIDVLIESIAECPARVNRALKLCLTAASGQMTKMVFAVTGRGKTKGKSGRKTEVGSWVIGYWRPRQHFEVNVWNCFERRTSKLIKALRKDHSVQRSPVGDSVHDVIENDMSSAILCGDCRALLSEMPDESIHLVLTDPPHSDRVPYLELSEFWNSILGLESDFDLEIVNSNAKGRDKSYESYCSDLGEFFEMVSRVLHRKGYLVILYNARESRQWMPFRRLCRDATLNNDTQLYYVGFFPCVYSAGSVVQDNRKGSLKTDYAIVFARANHGGSREEHIRRLSTIPGWSSSLPQLILDGDV